MKDAAAGIVCDLVGLLTENDRALLRLCLSFGNARQPGVRPAPPLDDDTMVLAGKLQSILCFDAHSGAYRFVSGGIARLVANALDAATARSGGQVERILSAQAEGEEEQAVALFQREGGIYFIHYHGLDAALDILNRFSAQAFERHEMLTLALAMHALKAGNINRARHLIVQRFGETMLALETAIAAGDLYSAEARAFRFVMAIYEDAVVSNQLRERLFELLAEYPVDDHLHRGSFYNAMLAVCIQRQQFDVAEDIANRAHHHYREADCHLLVFYIELHRVVFSLRRGLLGAAETSLEGAKSSLAQVTFDTPTDHRLLGLMEATIAYEKGESEALVRFITEEFDKFAYGEIWPTVVELALVYCSQALNNQIGLGAALSFLDKWRVQEWRSRRFNLAITMREVDILQTANRWQAAADRLMAVQSRINLTWVESAEEALTRLVDPIEIELAMAWLRHLIQQVPRRPILRDQLAALLKNDNIGERDRGRLHLWSAYLARMHRDVSQARWLFSKVLEDVARMGIVTHLLSEIAIINTLTDDKRIVAHALSSGERRNVIRKLQKFRMRTDAQNSVLTRQEMRVLRLVAEGGTNKFVARQLRLSEVTIKFHLSNIYRKIGCRRRKEAIAAARTRGWIE